MSAPTVEAEPVVSTYVDADGAVVVRAVHVGPTWDIGPDGSFVLPTRTLGWQCIEWAERYLLGADGNPWRFTDEQARFILWWYALDEYGNFAYQEGVLQRLKGWGKDPLIAVVCAIEWIGPCRFLAWDSEGEPIGVENPQAWIQVAAVSQEQTANTMRVMQTLFSDEAIKKYRVKVGIVKAYAFNGKRVWEAVTSSPASLEGGRPSFVVKNETHHWLSNNQGHDMEAVINRNLAKSSLGRSRTLAITNAYDPSADSVAQRTREAYEQTQAGTSAFTGLLYDSLEAPPGAPLVLDAPGTPGVEAVLRGVRGDAVWLDIPRMVNQILDPRNPPSQSRRFWYNQIVAAEDAWVDPAWVDITSDTALELLAGDRIVIFGDGSKSDDSTGLVACRVTDGALFTLGVWQRPDGTRGSGWLAPREEVDAVVVRAMADFDVLAFWFDPSHAKDDSDSTPYWNPLCDKWHREYAESLRYHAVTYGGDANAVRWDMASPSRQSTFVSAAEQFVTDLESDAFKHDGHPAFKAHLRNARNYPTPYGMSLSKRNRESKYKIDLAVCGVGARMLRRIVLNRDAGGTKKAPSKQPGRMWGYQR